MSIRDFVPKMRVRNAEGKEGTVCPDLPGYLSCNDPEEISVVYDGTTEAWGTDYRELEILGMENAVPDMKACGTGKGKDCCIFLVVGSNGPECERHGKLRWTLIFQKMVAEREPEEPYPACMIFREEASCACTGNCACGKEIGK